MLTQPPGLPGAQALYSWQVAQGCPQAGQHPSTCALTACIHSCMHACLLACSSNAGFFGVPEPLHGFCNNLDGACFGHMPLVALAHLTLSAHKAHEGQAAIACDAVTAGMLAHHRNQAGHTPSVGYQLQDAQQRMTELDNQRPVCASAPRQYRMQRKQTCTLSTCACQHAGPAHEAMTAVLQHAAPYLSYAIIRPSQAC